MTSPINPTPYDEDDAAAQLKRKRLRKRRLILRTFAGVIVMVAIVWALYYFLDARWYESTDDSYVNGNVVEITPQIPGTVVSIGADDNDFVREGETLVTLDRSDADVRLAQAEAALAQTVRRVRGMYSTAHSAGADVAVRQAVLKQAQDDFNRRRGLAKSGAISAEELDHARDALVTAESNLAAAQGQLATARAPISDTQLAGQPDVKAAAANVRAAWLDDARTTILAPVAGYVAKRTVQVGQRVQPGTPLMAVVPLKAVWVDANFKETQMGRMRIGQPVTLTSDIYGGSVKYDGRVQGLGMGTGSAFSLLPAQNASGNWIKIVQRLPVRITLDPKQVEQHPLRIGMSMDAEVSLRDQKGAMLAVQAPAQPVYATDVYVHHWEAADAIIARIIHANGGDAAGTAAATAPTGHAAVARR